jgi:Domain of unknown function (DUF4369)
MRYFNTIILFFATIISVSAQQANGFVLKGSIAGLQSGSVFLLYKGDDGKSKQEQVAVANGRFELKGSVSSPRHCYVSTSGALKPGEFFLENKEISLSFDNNSPDKLAVKGSPATDQFLAFQNSEKDIVQEYASLEDVYFKAIQQDDKKLHAYADSVKAAVNIRHREHLKTFCAANPQSAVGEYLVLRAMEFDHDLAGIQSVYALLDRSLAEDCYGKLIAGKLQEMRDVASEKADADFDSHSGK